MPIHGMMAGWTEDDTHCQGSCGHCDRCDERSDIRADDDYERYYND